MQSICGDNEPLVPLTIQDNLDFFSQSAEALLRYSVGIRLATGMPITRTGFQQQNDEQRRRDPEYAALYDDEDYRIRCVQDYGWARERFDIARPDRQKRDINFGDILTDLKAATPLQRMLFYLLVRTHRRHFTALVDRESSDQKAAFAKEATQLADQIDTLRAHVKEREKATMISECLVFDGKYSRACSITATAYKANLETVKSLVVYKDGAS